MSKTSLSQTASLPPVGKELRYAFYLLFHPFKGFWDIKHEKKGSLLTAGILLIAFLLSQICSSLYTGYLFSDGGLDDFNLFRELFKWFFLFFGWCLSNWCLTCLFDGEGTFGDIFKATAFCFGTHDGVFLCPHSAQPLFCPDGSHLIFHADEYRCLVDGGVGHYWDADYPSVLFRKNGGYLDFHCFRHVHHGLYRAVVF